MQGSRAARSWRQAALVACWAGVACGLWLGAPQPAARAGPDVAAGRAPDPIEDDAQLFGLHFIGSRHGWAVGDHGVIWHTEDGGQTWRLQASGVTCSLRGVYFIDDRVGWVVGGATQPFTHRSCGVVLKTQDGGQTWRALVDPRNGSMAAVWEGPAPNAPSHERLAGKQQADPRGRFRMPFLQRVRFFTPQRGLAVGKSIEGSSGGLYQTEDGGQSWRPLETTRDEVWLAASFSNPGAGALAGFEGAQGRLIDGKLEVLRGALAGARSVRDLALCNARDGWLVGDGAQLLQTRDGGRIWQAPEGGIPPECRELFDFRAVACRSDKVWVAGSPGSVVWHSSDGGRTWIRQHTGQSLPILALYFATDSLGWAVGALGMVLHTQNGGETWQAQRGGGRRLALMHLAPRGDHVLLELGAAVSAEMGYRAMVLVAAPEHQGRFLAARDLEPRLHEAFTRAGGSGAAVCWQFPLLAPSAERDFNRLIEDWNRRNEGRLQEVMVAHFVRQFRTWRPSAVILEQPAENDAAAQFVFRRAQEAMEQAADPTRWLLQQELAGLEPWGPERLFVHLPSGSTADVTLDRQEYLPRVGATVAMAVGEARGLLEPALSPRGRAEAFRLFRGLGTAARAAAAGGRFLGGLNIPYNSDARRPAATMDREDSERRLKLAQRERNLAAYTQRMLGDERKAAQLLAQLGESLADFPERQAALQLAQIAARYEAAGHWELAERVLVNLAERFPDQPVALRAMERLVQLWCSDELTWRKLRQEVSGQHKLQSDPDQARQAIARAEARLRKQAQESSQTIFDKLAQAQDEPRAGNLDPGEEDDIAAIHPAALERRDERIVLRQYQRHVEQLNNGALQLARRMGARDPAATQRPELAFPVAAVHRRRGKFDGADNLYRRLAQQSGPWQQAAVAELWLIQPWAAPEFPLATCATTHRRPVLDGVLSDPCWQAAEELRLAFGPRIQDSPPALAFLCCDDQYLYWGATVPRVAGTPGDRPDGHARRHDEPLDDFDRLTLYLDVDRDYVTCYAFSVDQRGCTAEQCCGDASWNPKWFVAVDVDQAEWRMEAAIPLQELGPRAPVSGEAWAMAVVRAVPGVDLASWSRPAGVTPRPEMFGLLRFE